MALERIVLRTIPAVNESHLTTVPTGQAADEVCHADVELLCGDCGAVVEMKSRPLMKPGSPHRCGRCGAWGLVPEK
jgi:hypothetical protein